MNQNVCINIIRNYFLYFEMYYDLKNNKAIYISHNKCYVIDNPKGKKIFLYFNPTAIFKIY